jgi:transposase
MAKHTTGKGTTVGLDLGDKQSTYAVLDADGEVTERGKVATTAPALEKLVRRLGQAKVVLEVGTHSPWVSRSLKGKGLKVVVANPRQLALISRSQRKNDRNDAELLARLGRLDEALLSPIEHRGQEAQEHRAIIQARAQLVVQRSALINHVRGTVKAHGERLPSSSAPYFATKMAPLIPAGLRAALLPILALIEQLGETVRQYERELERLAKELYPETRALRQVVGVGALTALTYVLTLEERGRFKRSRQVGAYLGLVPRQQESGERRPELHITKAGDSYLRTLLVQCAHYIMGPFGPDTKLRRWGLKLAGAGSTARKKRALVAVARKLAVLLHRLWVSGEVYEPFYGEEQPIAA